jgi:hypothetical protein
MKQSLLIFALATITQAALADSPKPPIIKIVYRLMAPKLPADSWGVKPKTLYIGGDTYSRLEEAADPEQRIHGLIITSEPDLWMINLFGRRGQHIVDPGPTFVTHHNILGMDAPKEFSALEFGKELDFFKIHHATPGEAKVIDQQHCDALEFGQASYRVVLYVRSDTYTPYQLDIFKDDKPQYSLRYQSYETGIPFDAALFQPPPDISITEAKGGFHTIPP